VYLFYVYGAGLGHLNRIANFIYTHNIAEEECVIITNSSFSNYIAKPITVIHKNDSFFKNNINFNQFIKDCIKTYQISTLIIDVFPAGFYGEFEKGFKHFKVKTILLARILNEAYFKTYFSPNYDLIYFLEDGITKEYYKAKKTDVLGLKIKPIRLEKTFENCKKPFFIIIHSSPKEEVLLLYKQALLYKTNEHIYLYTYQSIPNSVLNDETTVILKQKVQKEMLEKADKIFTGCGFNTIMETKHYRDKQYIIPFKRKYDDQFARKRIINSLKKI